MERNRINLAKEVRYNVLDFLTNEPISHIPANRQFIEIKVSKADAVLLKFVPAPR